MKKIAILLAFTLLLPLLFASDAPRSNFGGIAKEGKRIVSIPLYSESLEEGLMGGYFSPEGEGFIGFMGVYKHMFSPKWSFDTEASIMFSTGFITGELGYCEIMGAIGASRYFPLNDNFDFFLSGKVGFGTLFEVVEAGANTETKIDDESSPCVIAEAGLTSNMEHRFAPVFSVFAKAAVNDFMVGIKARCSFRLGRMR